MYYICTKCGTKYERHYKSRHWCNSCKNEEARRRYKSNTIKEKQRVQDYRKNNPEKIKAYRNSTREKAAAYSRNWYKSNREKRLTQTRQYREKYPEKYRGYTAMYKAVKLQATPTWADLEAIKEFYKNCPEGYEVDHIHPLQGRNICGLHVIDNLQYLTVSENRKKHCKFEPES